MELSEQIALFDGEQQGCTIVLEEAAADGRKTYHDTPLPFASGLTRGFRENCIPKQRSVPAQDIPDKIQEMLGLYQHGDGSLSHKAMNFYRQGKLMEDYEDHAPWEGEYRRYFPTYHDLNVRQLRGYFTWRTQIRQGNFYPIATSLAYIYLYELLNGIGADSPEDALCKMREFEKGYLESGVGDSGMRKNLRRWMLEYAILHGLPAETVLQYTPPEMRERDAALAVLKTPGQYADDEIFSALSAFAGKALGQSPVVTKDEARRLFAEIWKYLSEHYHENGKDIFTACFGERKAYRWYPLSNAVYYDEQVMPDTSLALNECRSYHYRGGIWQEERYERLYFDKALLQSVIHAADRMLRKRYQTGRYLREKQEEAWLTPYITAVLDAELEAQKPKIAIDFSSLAQIRQEALVTRDSLLTEEETGEDENPVPEEPAKLPCEAFDGLDALHLQILAALLSGQSVEGMIKDQRLMPSVVTDTINEALFDEIGDNVLECGGDRIMLVEDYREDVIEALGGVANE